MLFATACSIAVPKHAVTTLVQICDKQDALLLGCASQCRPSASMQLHTGLQAGMRRMCACVLADP